ncbi:MAG TPA: putative Fe-S cluster assembly protein SufT [Zeimonas sp.]
MGNRYADSRQLTLARDCPAVAVPWGTAETLTAGQLAQVTQRLGGTITVMVGGNLYRVEEKDADALGLEPGVVAPVADLDAGDTPTAEAVEAAAWKVLATCYDPEIPIDIVNLGLVYTCFASALENDRFRLDVQMTLTAPGCGMGTLLCDEAREKLLKIPGVDQAKVELVFDPPWTRYMMSEAARLEMGLT